MKITFFRSPMNFRRWLEKNHAAAAELVVGFYKKDSGRGGITYAEALDEALCFGWIDGVRRSIDAISYSTRFTPRRLRSIWSRINIEHAERLKKAGKMTPAGLKAFAARDPKRTGLYSFENAARKLGAADGKKFRADKKAWVYFRAQAPWYQRTAVWWVVSARKDETRLRRLARLMEDSANSRRLGHLTNASKKSP